MFRSPLTGFALAFCGAVSCATQYQPDPRMAPASRELEPSERLSAPERALSAIANTRCDQEVLCNQVGEKQRYPNRAECVSAFGKQAFQELGLDQCRGSTDQAELSICLNSIRILVCSSTPADVYLIDACRSELLCRP